MTSDLEKALSLHRSGQFAECKRIYRRLVRRRPDDHAALHWLGVLHAQQGELQEAEGLLKRAAAIAPDQAIYHVNLGTVLKKQRRLGESLECFKRALAIDADNPEILNSFGSALLALGRENEALPYFDEALAKAPDFLGALTNAGIAQQALGRLEEATETFTKAVAVNPGDADAHSNLGLILHLRGKLPEAQAALVEAVRLDPANASAHNNLGLAYLAQGEPGKARDCFTTVLDIEPHHPDAHANLGRALEQLGRAEDAIRHCRMALSLAGELPHLQMNLASALGRAGQMEESLSVLRTVVSRHPESLPARTALGFTLMKLGNLQGASAEFQKALELRPDDAYTLNSLGLCRLTTGDAAGAIASFRQAASLDPGYVRARSNLLLALNYLPAIDRSELYEAHKAFAETFERPLRPCWPAHRNVREPERRLKLAYVSGDFYQHAVSFFSEPVLSLHDKSRFEVFCLHAGSQDDAFTARFRRHADHWLSIAHLSNDAACALVRELEIDILVDLSGHTAGNRLGAFMRKPAPVRVHWLGYLTTTGLQSIDYRITDARADPPGESDRYYSERLVRLPSVWAFAGPGEPGPEVSPLPCLVSTQFTFACFNAVAKITDEVIECWSSVLHRVSDSVLALGNAGDAQVAAGITERFAYRGIPESRLRFAPRLPLSEFLKLHHDVDLALDPFPYNGGVTTCHALWMGVPPVTLKGDRYMARIGADMLEQLGLDHFVASSRDEYVDLAVGWAHRRAELAEIRRTLRQRLRDSALGDVAGFTRELESAYRQMWRAWC